MEALYYITPLDESIMEYVYQLPEDSIGRTIHLRTEDILVDIPENAIILIGVPEDRNAVNNAGTGMELKQFRKEFYKYFKGNWRHPIFDLGDLRQGAEYEDTDKLLKEIGYYAITHNIIPIFIGGSHALTYSLYRSFDKTGTMVNLSVVDPQFDLGLGNNPDGYDSRSFLHKIILEEPLNLKSYCNIGYQTFANSQKEIRLMKQMMFAIHRLGNVQDHMERAEAAIRDSHIVSIDLKAVRRSDAPANPNGMVSGFNGSEICRITRYAGLSENVKMFGIFEYNERYDKECISASLVAQMIWYFIEGVNLRIHEDPAQNPDSFKKFIVPYDEDSLIFYKSLRTERWWIEILTKRIDNKIDNHTFIPCTKKDYLDAVNGQIPDLWHFNTIKNNYG